MSAFFISVCPHEVHCQNLDSKRERDVCSFTWAGNDKSLCPLENPQMWARDRSLCWWFRFGKRGGDRLQLKVTLSLGSPFSFSPSHLQSQNVKVPQDYWCDPSKESAKRILHYYRCVLVSSAWLGLMSLRWFWYFEPPLVLMFWVSIGTDVLSLHWFWCLEPPLVLISWAMKILEAYFCSHSCSLTLSGRGREEKHLAITYPQWQVKCWGGLGRVLRGIRLKLLEPIKARQ